MTLIIVKLFSSLLPEVDGAPIDSIECNALSEGGADPFNSIMEPIFKKISWYCKYMQLKGCYKGISESEVDALFIFHKFGKDPSRYVNLYSVMYPKDFENLACNVENKKEVFGKSGPPCPSKLICLKEFHDLMINKCPNGQLWKNRMGKVIGAMDWCEYVLSIVKDFANSPS